MHSNHSPKLRRASAFGPEYEQLLLTIWKKTPFRFPMESQKTLRAMRAKVYAYFRHLREENIRLDLIEMADSITLSCEGDVIVFVRNSETWDHEKLRALLGLKEDAYGLHAPDGTELEQPDLLPTRLGKQLTKLREREAGSKQVIPPFKG